MEDEDNEISHSVCSKGLDKYLAQWLCPLRLDQESEETRFARQICNLSEHKTLVKAGETVLDLKGSLDSEPDFKCKYLFKSGSDQKLNLQVTELKGAFIHLFLVS